MALLAENDREAIRGHFDRMTADVTVTLTKAPGVNDTENILKELCELTERLTLNIVESNGETTVLPTLSIGRTGRVIFRGTPSGYEFSSLLTAIIDAGRDAGGLSDETRNFLNDLQNDLHIKVFVTPTCPHCPPSVVLAHRMAAYSSRVTAEAIEANEFPDMAAKYEVQGVPRTVVNESFASEGAQPESYFIEALKRHLESGRKAL
jgi:glutaredoxin-like protein